METKDIKTITEFAEYINDYFGGSEEFYDFPLKNDILPDFNEIIENNNWINLHHIAGDRYVCTDGHSFLAYDRDSLCVKKEERYALEKLQIIKPEELIGSVILGRRTDNQDFNPQLETFFPIDKWFSGDDGLFYNGPINIENESMAKRLYSWVIVLNVFEEEKNTGNNKENNEKIWSILGLNDDYICKLSAAQTDIYIKK